MVINLAPVSLNNKKVNFYTCSRLTFLKKICHGKCLKEHYWATRSQNYLGVCPQTPLAVRAFRRSKLASSCFEVWLRPCALLQNLSCQGLWHLSPWLNGLCNTWKVLLLKICVSFSRQVYAHRSPQKLRRFSFGRWNKNSFKGFRWLRYRSKETTG